MNNKQTNLLDSLVNDLVGKLDYLDENICFERDELINLPDKLTHLDKAMKLKHICDYLDNVISDASSVVNQLREQLNNK